VFSSTHPCSGMLGAMPAPCRPRRCRAPPRLHASLRPCLLASVHGQCPEQQSTPALPLSRPTQGNPGSQHFMRYWALQPGSVLTRRFFANHPTVLQVGPAAATHACSARRACPCTACRVRLTHQTSLGEAHQSVFKQAWLGCNSTHTNQTRVKSRATSCSSWPGIPLALLCPGPSMSWPFYVLALLCPGPSMSWPLLWPLCAYVCSSAHGCLGHNVWMPVSECVDAVYGCLFQNVWMPSSVSLHTDTCFRMCASCTLVGGLGWPEPCSSQHSSDYLARCVHRHNPVPSTL